MKEKNKRKKRKRYFQSTF